MVFGHSDSGMRRHRRAIGAFPNQRSAEEALADLRAAGFPMERVSIVARGPQPREELARVRYVGNKSDEGAASGVIAGGLLGTLTGLLVGLGTLAIPGVGPVMLSGATATAVATTLAGTGIGAVAGGLLGALIGLGIPEKDARHYHDRIMRGEYLLVVDGSDSEIAQVEQILHHRRIDAYKVYDAPVLGGAAGTRSLEEPYYRRFRPNPAFHQPMAGPSMVVHETPAPHDTHVQREPRQVRALEEPFYRHRHPHHTAPQPVVAAPVPLRETSDVGRHRAIASYANSHDAEEAITRLHHANFPLGAVSLIARRIERRDAFSGVDLRDRLDAPRYGIPSNRSHLFDERLDRGNYLVTVTGTEEEIRRAAAILATCGMTSWDVYDPAVDYASPAASRADTVIEQPPVRAAGISPLPMGRPTPPPPPPPAPAPSSIPASTPSTIPSSGVPVPPPPSAIPASPPPTIASSGAPVPPPPSAIASSPTSHHPLQHYRAIGLFTRRQDTEAALFELRNSGFSMDQISILSRDAGQGSNIAGVDIHQRTGNKADEGAKAGATTGAALGSLGGLLVGLGALAIPGIGPVLAGGAVATAIATTLTGGAIGAATGGIVGALVGLGIPENRARVYNERFNRGDDLIIVDGNEADIRYAEAILKRHRIHEWERFEAEKVEPQTSASSDVRRDGTVIDRPSVKENERLGIRDERVDTTQSKRVRPNADPEVIIVDRRHDPRQS